MAIISLLPTNDDLPWTVRLTPFTFGLLTSIIYQLTPAIVWQLSAAHLGPNTERRMPNAASWNPRSKIHNRKIPLHLCHPPNTERPTPNAEYRTPKAGSL